MSNLRKKILKLRLSYLKNNPAAFQGNSKTRTDYLIELNRIEPTNFQIEYVIGLILSDVSFDFEGNVGRLKLQQSEKHLAWMEHIRDILREYMPRDGQLSHPSQNRPHMYELQTLKCEPLYKIVQPIFYNENKRKTINRDLISTYIGPACVAAWFCGDGSKSDFTDNEGKGLTFHSQGFSKEEVEFLAECLRKNLKIEANAKLDYDDKYRIDVSGASYDLFVKEVGPYIHPTFFHRVPTGRAEGSRFGSVTEKIRSDLLGSGLKDLDSVIDNYTFFTG